MTLPPTRVVKLGGSLLDLGDLIPRLRVWLAAQPPMRNVIVVGGGDLADVVRAVDARHRLGEENAHWLCVRLLGITAELLAQLLPGTRLLRRWDELSCCQERLSIVFDCEHFLRHEEPRLPPEPLPHTWAVTSDSIAARLAAVLGAGELVLLKSCLPQPGCNIGQAAAEGYVDRHFPCAAACLPCIRCVDLRDPQFAAFQLLPPTA